MSITANQMPSGLISVAFFRTRTSPNESEFLPRFPLVNNADQLVLFRAFLLGKTASLRTLKKREIFRDTQNPADKRDIVFLLVVTITYDTCTGREEKASREEE